MENDSPATEANYSRDHQAIFAALRDALAELYPEENGARIVVSDAGVDAKQITFSSRAQTNWHNILAEAIQQNRLGELLDIARNEYLDNQPLAAAYTHYRRFLEQGNQLEPQIQLPIIGDVITARIGDQANMVAVGKNITQIVYQHVTPQSLNAATLAAADARLAQLPLDTIPTIATLPLGSRMPFSMNPLFVGREADLMKLAAALKGGGTVAVGQIAAATGLGGIGKTQLAVAFVHHYGQFFQGGVHWLSFADSQSVPAEIAASGAMMTDIRVDYATLDLETQVRQVLAAWQSPLPRLLVFDNCEEPALLAQWRPPTGGSRVLVTCRRRSWDASLGVQLLALDTLTRFQSIELLCKFRPDLAATDPQLDQIAAELGDLPLALHLAGSYLARYHQVVSPAHYLAQLRQPDLLQHRSLQAGDLSPTGHIQHVARTFALSYSRLDSDDSTDNLALKLLARAAHFAPSEAILSPLLLASVGIDGAEADTIIQPEDALLRLSELGLVEIVGSKVLRLHRLLARFVQDMDTDGTAQIDVENAVIREANRLNEAHNPNPLLTWQLHLRYLTERAHLRYDEQAAALCNEMGEHLHYIGDFTGARSYFDQALTIRLQILGKCHVLTAESLSNLGWLLQAQGDFAAARSYNEQALIIRRELLGEYHSETITSLINLGSVLRDLGDLAESLHYLKQALTIQRTMWGEDHVFTSATLNNLGLLLKAQGDLAGARLYYEQALIIRRKVLGDHHPDTAISFNNLGSLLLAQGEITAARPNLEQALTIRREVFGDQHPNTAVCLGNLGKLLQAEGDLEGARSYLEQALTIFQQQWGLEHPYTRKVRGYLEPLIIQSERTGP